MCMVNKDKRNLDRGLMKKQRYKCMEIKNYV